MRIQFYRFVTEAAWVAPLAWVQFLGQELPHAHKQPQATSHFSDLDVGPEKALVGLAPPSCLSLDKARGDQPQTGVCWYLASRPRPRLPSSTTSAQPSSRIAGAGTDDWRGYSAAPAKGRAERAPGWRAAGGGGPRLHVTFRPSQRRRHEAAPGTVL